MTRSKSNSSARPVKAAKSGARKGSPRASNAGRGTSKHSQILRMLQSKRGATVVAIGNATGWQLHSVRGFLAGVVKKKLGLNLVSEKTKSGRVYRIAEGKPRPAGRPETATETAHA
jgi:hypothetical protein